MDRVGHLPRDRAQLGAVPPDPTEDHLVRTEGTEPPGARRDRRLRHESRLRATERLHREVRVGEQDERGAVGRQDVQQPHRRGGGLLVVVDHDEAPPGTEHTGQVGLPGLQGIGRLVDDHCGVVARTGVGGGGAQAGHVEVLGVQLGGGGPLRSRVTHAQRIEVRRQQPTLGRAHQQVTQLVAEGPEAQRLLRHTGRPRDVDALGLGVARQELGQDEVLLGTADQGRCRITEQRVTRPQHREGCGGGCPDDRHACRPEQPR